MTELPVFYFAGKLVSRMGARRVLDASAAAYVVRLLGYTLLGPTAGPAAILPLEALHGIAFAGEKRKRRKRENK